MKKKLIFAAALLIFLSTITLKNRLVISKLKLKEVIVENNSILKKQDIKNLLNPIYGENLLLIKNNDIKTALMQNDFIEDFKWKYPNTLKKKINEKSRLQFLINKKKKYYLSEKIDLIKFRNIKKYGDLPYILGNINDFEVFYNNLKTINFPFEIISRYTFYETRRWDLETINKKIIKLPVKNYNRSLISYLEIKNKNDFTKYKIFDYRLENQLILKWCMNNSFQTLYIEITETHFNFFVGENDDNNNYINKYKLEVQIQGIEKNRVSDLDKAFSLIKKTIYLIEQKFNSTFKEIVLILENFNPSFINISGYKKLNGSQILKENITYILNSLKSYVSKNDSNKKIIHIFNSNFCLDNKKIENLPIGLFGEFYSHELSFTINNDFKNLENIW